MTQRLPDAQGRPSDRENGIQDRASGCDFDDRPPAYESLETVESAATTTPRNPTGGPEANDKAPVRPEFVYTWNNCKIGQGWGAVGLDMSPNPHRSGFRGLPWAAGLLVKCRDVPRLMREGFFWSAEDILPEGGYMSHSTPPEWSHIGFAHERVWSLADRSNGETPLWVARLNVLSPSIAILKGFRPDTLSRENVHKAHAWNAEKRLVYHFEYLSPGDCYNTIYNDMPLQGWWPWPRSTEGWTRRGVDVSGLAAEPEHAGGGLSLINQHNPSPQPQRHQEPGGCIIF